MNTPCGKTLFYSILFLMLILILASACTSTPDVPGSDPGAAPLPAYQKGMTYTYSDGSWETVTAIAAGSVAWIDHRGKTSKGSPDFSYRRAEWRTKSRRGYREFTPRSDLLNQGKDTLWPLQAGNAVSYSEITTRVDQKGAPESSQTQWTCRVAGTEKVSVLAGEFDTWKINCNRYSVSAKSDKKSRLREEKFWYYAPQIGHWVLNTSTYYYDKKPLRLELMAVLPPSDQISGTARFEMEKSFQQALEGKKRGFAVTWSIPNAGISGDVVPAETFKDSKGTYCRRYVQKLNLANDRHIYYGMACRDSLGRWQVPRR
jgi:hypothetical protein